MIKLTILDGHAVNPGDLPWDIFKEIADVTVFERTQQNQICERIGNSDAIFLNKINITEEILQSCPNLKYIGVLATGYNVVDIEAAKKHNIVVTNIPAYSSDSVAQHVFSFILHFTNHITSHNASVKNGDWIRCPDFCYWNAPLTELKGKTLGILGYGNIGKKVCEIGKAFGMNVISTTRSPKENMPPLVSWEELLKCSDFLTLHAPLTPATENIINKDSLRLMKSTSYLINTARGGFIVEEDLSKALNDGVIAGYAADVISQEPMKENNPLLSAKNCIITPHIAWAPLETRSRLQKIAFQNLKGWIEGKIQNQIN